MTVRTQRSGRRRVSLAALAAALGLTAGLLTTSTVDADGWDWYRSWTQSESDDDDRDDEEDDDDRDDEDRDDDCDDDDCDDRDEENDDERDERDDDRDEQETDGSEPTAVTFDEPVASPDSAAPAIDAGPGQTLEEGAPVAAAPVTHLTDVVDQIGAAELWSAGFTGEGIDVAVIDTGFAPVAELARTDVVMGPDLSLEGGVAELAGLDGYGHGTHMVGIIAGRTPGADPLDPRPGDLLGVAPDAGIVSVKVADNTGATDISQVIAAIDWVVQHRNSDGLNIRVLNLSFNTFGTESYVLDPLAKAVENAWENGIVVVVSAGTDERAGNGLANPATHPAVIAVSSAHLDDAGGWSVPAWAPTGQDRHPDVLAPGVSIASLRVPGSRADLEHPTGLVADDDRLFRGTGTSQSAAVVSGAAALLLDQRPELTPDQVKALLAETALDTGDDPARQGHGVIDLAAAMGHATPDVVQSYVPATGLGSLEAARGDDHIEVGGEELTGEVTVTGAKWDARAWVEAIESGSVWSSDGEWAGSAWFHELWQDWLNWFTAAWSGSTWSGSTWSGSTWSGSTWSGSTWSGSTWSGSTWSGSTWSGSTWSGSTWSGSTWSGSTWSGSTWSGSTWSGSTWT